MMTSASIALKSALRKHQTPVIFNTDQGAQYTSKAFTGALKDHGVQISMNGNGGCMDNIFIERLWSIVWGKDYYLIVIDYISTVLILIEVDPKSRTVFLMS